MRKEKYSDLVEKIRHQNTFLDNLSRQSRELQSIRSVKRIPNFERVRSSATNIFESLRRGLYVSCAAAHRASICLTASLPEGPVSGKMHHSSSEGKFRIVLHHDLGVQQPPSSWSTEEAEIRLLDSISVTISPPEPSPPVIRPGNKGKKKVGFQDVTIAPTIPLHPPAATAPEILDLCQSLNTFATSQCGICLGYMECLTSKSRHELYHPKQRLLGQTTFSVTTLSGILDHKASTYRKISGRDARKLAVPLANGMLRLHSTPWLHNSWNPSDIMLVCQNGRILAEYPFVSQDMTATGALSATSPQALHGLAASVIKDRMLFTLGIVLIELCMKQSIDDLHIPSELNTDGSKHDLSDFQTAVRLLETNAISDEFGERWSEVVYRCIHCNLDAPKKTLENDAYRKAFYAAIVLKLEEEHRQMFSLE